MIMNNDSEERGGLTSLSGSLICSREELEGSGTRQRWRLTGGGGRKPRENGYILERKKIRDDVTVLSDSTSRPLDMQNCLSTRPFLMLKRKSMEAQPN